MRGKRRAGTRAHVGSCALAAWTHMCTHTPPHAYARVRTYTLMRARTHACRHTQTHTGTYTRTRIPPRRHAHSCVLTRNTEMQTRACAHTARRACAHSHACAALCGAGGKLHSMVRVRELLGFPPDRTIVAGDSGGPVLVRLCVCLPPWRLYPPISIFKQKFLKTQHL